MTSTRIRAFHVEGPAFDLFISDCTCGVVFGMPADLERRRRDDRRDFYCPNGHRLRFEGPTDAQKLEESSVREASLRDQLTASIREGEQTRQALLRDRHRYANGVCPCCSRTFDNVRRHMASKHPEYDVRAVAKPVRYACSCGASFDSYRGLRSHQGRVRADDWAKPGLASWRSHLTEGATR